MPHPQKKLLIITLSLAFSCAFTEYCQADIIDAKHAYEEQSYDSAFEQFQSLANLGSDQARHGLAVMYLKGHGTKQDLNRAYAWAKLIDYTAYPKWSNLVQIIESELDENQIQQAQKTADEVKAKFGDEHINTQLAPIKYVPQSDKSSSNDYKVTIIERKAPRYPKSEFRFGTQGWVNVQFDVFPDGSTRNPAVIDSIPEGVFDEVTIEAIQGFKFKLEFKPGIEPHPIIAQQVIQYTLHQQNKPSLQKLYSERLQKLKSQAEQGNPTAQYYYAIAASDVSLVKDYVALEAEEANQWLLKSAQNGNLDAQYQLGYNILTGKGCQVEKQKGVDWIVHAATQGHAKSARQAYRQLTEHNHLNTTDNPPEYWLKIAADNGDPEAQLDYAHFLANNGNDERAAAARTYLKSYLKERDKSVKYHQTSALLYQLENNQKKAQKEQKKAEKMAKKLGWSLISDTEA